MPEIQLPTAAEIEQAWKAIDDAGPQAHDTLLLSMLAVENPRLWTGLERMTAAGAVALKLSADAQHKIMFPVMMAAMVTGLNYGLRIAAARVKDKRV